jgi:predicted amidohydrolase
MEKGNLSRRSFVKQSAMGVGAIGMANPVWKNNSDTTNTKLPCEVFVAGFCSDGLNAATSEEMVDLVEDKLQSVIPFQPDIVCLPEIFSFSGVKQKMNVKEKAEYSTNVIEKFSKWAKNNNAYVICAVITGQNGKFYNAAVLLDRNGKYVGEYRKMHPTDNEMFSGISPGPIDPPVFDTDFGRIGIQICFDIRWNDGWENLQKKGCEIIFWPSAFPAGNLLNTRAWQHQAVIVSSALKGSSKICDVTGKDINLSGRWQQFWTGGLVNLEKVFIHIWPYINRFEEVQKKYGRKIRIEHLYDEEISIIESRSPEVFVKDILEEFEIKTFTEHIAYADELQKKAHKSGVESLKRNG